MPVAAKTISGFVLEHTIPTRIANRIVKTIKIGRPYFR